MTWNTLQYYYSGQQLSVADWNNYIGGNGNIAYLRNQFYMQYSASFISSFVFANNTVTSVALGARNGNGTSFFIPTSWPSGRYYYQATMRRVNDGINGYRAIRPVINNASGSWNANRPTSGPVDYEYQGIVNLSPTNKIGFDFFQNEGGPLAFNIFFMIQRIGS